MIVEALLTTRSLGYESIQYFVWFACIFLSVEYLALCIVNALVEPASRETSTTSSTSRPSYRIPNFDDDPVMLSLAGWRPVKESS